MQRSKALAILLAALVEAGGAWAQTGPFVPAGRQFRVNSYVQSHQRRPAVALVPRGMVVTRESSGSGETDTSSSSVQARRFGPAWSALGAKPTAAPILAALPCAAGLLALLRPAGPPRR